MSKTEINTIYHDDCLNFMGGVEDNFADVCFTSPPYNIRHDGDINNRQKRDKYGKSKYGGNEWREDWFEWQVSVIDEMLRIAKRLVIYNVQALRDSKSDVYRLIGHYADRIHDIVIWYKPNGQPSSTEYKVSNTYEFILIMRSDGTNKVDTTERFSRNVIVENVNSNPYSNVHGAVMPLTLCKKLIHRYTYENEIILDPFMGLGTTAIACKDLNRQFIGCEKEQKYIDIANERIEEFNAQMRMF